MDPRLRFVIITGGHDTGKTRAANRLIGRLGKEWRLVSLENYAPWPPWKEGAVFAAGLTLRHLGQQEKFPVLFDGGVDSGEISSLCAAYGVPWPSKEVTVIQLVCSPETAAQRHRDDSTRGPEDSQEQKAEGIKTLEAEVPPPVPGATVIVTDGFTEHQVLQKVTEALE